MGKTEKRLFTSGDKFWEIWVDGKALYTRHGTTGTTGQTKMYASPGDLEKKIAEKTKQGFKEAKAGKPADPSKPAKPRKIVVAKGAFHLEKGDKYFQIVRDDSKVTTWSGTIGKEDKTKPSVKKHADEWKARTTYQEALKKKLAEGFTYIAPGVAYPESKFDPELDARIANEGAREDDLLVYADWLQEQGDPRGELAVLQARRAKKPNDKALEKAEAKLLWDDRGRFFGPLAIYQVKKKPKYGRQPFTATWNHGWIDQLEVHATSTYQDDIGVPSVGDVETLIDLIPKVSSARHLRSLVIGCPVADDSFAFDDAIDATIAIWPPSLRSLEIGRFDAEDSECSWSNIGTLNAIWKKAKKLEHFKVKSGHMTLGKIEAPELRSFTVVTGGFDKSNLKQVVNAKWPKLEKLVLWLGQPEYGCDFKPKDLVPLLSQKFPHLTHLGLCNTIWGDELCKLVGESAIVAQIKHLDLNGSHLTTEGVKALAANKKRFDLETLDLSRCLIDKAGQKLAKTLAKKVDLERQYNPSEYVPDDEDTGSDDDATWWRYSRLGE